MLIIDMPMPISCTKCPMVGKDHFGQSRCNAQGGRLLHKFNINPKDIDRPSWCPIKGELPDEHGDLIDRDELRKMNVFSQEFNRYVVPMMYIEDANPIVAAERKDERRTR